MIKLMLYPFTPTENMLEIQGELNGSREEITRSEAKRVFIRTPTHPSFPSLSSSNMMSYINDTAPGERDVDKGEVENVLYIYPPTPEPPSY